MQSILETSKTLYASTRQPISSNWHSCQLIKFLKKHSAYLPPVLNNLSTGKFILSFNQSFSIILLMSSISFSDNFSCLPNAEINAGREPSNVFSTIFTISASCICSFETMEETIVFSFFITPLSDNLFHYRIRCCTFPT